MILNAAKLLAAARAGKMPEMCIVVDAADNRHAIKKMATRSDLAMLETVLAVLG